MLMRISVFIFLSAILLLIPVGELTAKDKSKSRSQKMLERGEALFSGKTGGRKGGREPVAFSKQITSLDLLQQHIANKAKKKGSKDGVRRRLLNLAGRLSDEDWRDLRYFVDERLDYSMRSKPGTPRYVAGMQWMFDPKPGALADDEASDRISDLAYLQRLQDAVARQGHLFGKDKQYGQLGKKFARQMSSFSQGRFGIVWKRLDDEDGALYQRGFELVTSGKPTLLSSEEAAGIKKMTVNSQASWLKRLKKKLPRQSAKIESWAGRLSVSV
jgi:hypothetical protein